MNSFSSHPLAAGMLPAAVPGRMRRAGLVLVAGCLSGCAPTINLATPQPVKMDIGVRLDIYQKTPITAAKDEQSSLTVAANRRLRSGEVQQLSAQHVVGEDRDGYLALKTPPKDPAALASAQKIVSDENADRAYLYSANAQAQNEPLEMVESNYAKLWRDRALPGEWIQREDGTWTQK